MKIRFNTTCSVLAVILSFMAMVISYNQNSNLREEAKKLDKRLAASLDQIQGPSYVVLTDNPPTEYPLKMSCNYPTQASLILEKDNTESIISYSTKVYRSRDGYTFWMGSDRLIVVNKSTKERVEEYTDCTKY